MNWAVAAFLSLFSYGLWGLFTKLSVMRIDSKSALVFQTIGALIIGTIIFSFTNFKTATDVKGIGYALMTGVLGAIGGLFYFIAASKGKIVTVVTLTALYPLITVILAWWLLKETVSPKQCAGIVLALVSIILMST